MLSNRVIISRKIHWCWVFQVIVFAALNTTSRARCSSIIFERWQKRKSVFLDFVVNCPLTIHYLIWPRIWLRVTFLNNSLSFHRRSSSWSPSTSASTTSWKSATTRIPFGSTSFGCTAPSSSCSSPTFGYRPTLRASGRRPATTRRSWTARPVNLSLWWPTGNTLGTGLHNTTPMAKSSWAK